MSEAWAWLVLVGAGLLEIVWGVGLKYTDSWQKPVPSAVVIGAYLACLYLLSTAVKYLPLGTAYAVWVGIGTMGIAAWGIFMLGESASPLRLACIGLIMLGVVGLKVSH